MEGAAGETSMDRDVRTTRQDGWAARVIAAVAIGGTSMAGGKGTIFGTFVGSLILGMLDNVMGLKGINSNLQLVVKGFLIIIAVFAQAVRKED